MNNELPINPGGTGDPLVALRAYHLPDPVGWWPPAPGWWLLLILLSVGVGAIVWWLAHRRTGCAAARHARRELRRLRRELATGGDSAHFTRQLSKLLRRFALAVFPRHQIAALTGEDWLRFLDTQGGNGRFCDGPGRQLLDAPYRRAVTGSVDQLTTLVADWIEQNRDRREPPAATRSVQQIAIWIGDWIGRMQPSVTGSVQQISTRLGDWFEHNRGRRT